jgi:hypothetical protein
MLNPVHFFQILFLQDFRKMVYWTELHQIHTWYNPFLQHPLLLTKENEFLNAFAVFLVLPVSQVQLLFVLLLSFLQVEFLNLSMQSNHA